VDFADLFPFAPEVGYLSLALVNFIGSLVPFVPLPGFLLLATMSVGDQFDLHVLALQITKEHYGADLTKHLKLFITEGIKKPEKISASPRIGIKEATDKLWNFKIEI